MSPPSLWPFFHYDKIEDWMDSKDLSVIVNVLTQTVMHYQQVYKEFTGKDDIFTGMKVTVVSDSNHPELAGGEVGGIAIKDQNWTYWPQNLSWLDVWAGRGRTQGHEMMHSILWRHFDSGRISVVVTHFLDNINALTTLTYDKKLFDRPLEWQVPDLQQALERGAKIYSDYLDGKLGKGYPNHYE